MTKNRFVKYIEHVRANNENLPNLVKNMEIDLHTLRDADRSSAANWAIVQKNWMMICADHEQGHSSFSLGARLLKRGVQVHFVCAECASENLKACGQFIHDSIENVDADVEIITLHSVDDHWSFIPNLSQRMQWFGDIKAIWPEAELNDERWNSELYDYGIAVVIGKSLAEALD